MIVNPHTQEGRALIRPLGDTHILEDTFGLVGTKIIDLHNRYREWVVHSLYAPALGRAVGGIRAKLVDQKGFITFCNQRDLEVLLEVASPGGWCQWLGCDYAEPSSDEWLGFCADDDDLIDDLYDRELEARALYCPNNEPLPNGLNFNRRVHGGLYDDFEEEMLLIADMCRETGMSPDARFETVINRWRSVERTAHTNRAKLWLRI
jgi:hypothetical protein